MTFHVKSGLLLIFCIVVTPFSFSLVAKADESRPDLTIYAKVDIHEHKVTGKIQTTFSVLKSSRVRMGLAKICKIQCQEGKKIPFTQVGGTLKVEKGLCQGNSVTIIFETEASPQSNIPVKSTITEDYVLLMDSWCPILDRPATYRLTLDIDKKLIPVSEADEVIEKISGQTKTVTFVFDHPRQSVTVAAARFYITETEKDGIRLAIYLLKKRQNLAGHLLDTLEKGLATYERLLSPYPFKRFQVVENPAPTGLTVPTITLIGSQIINKPFVVNTSLIHELVHSWFGNSVFVSEEGGNWCEGLTTYLADYLIEEKHGKGALYRHDILADYKSYVHGFNPSLALSRFKFRFDRTSKAIGYGKGAMVFHMLRKRCGDDAFFSIISRFSKDFRFKTASWKDIEGLFCKQDHGGNLRAFFDQWLNRSDVPIIKIGTCLEERNERGSFDLRLDLVQENKVPYRLHIPVRIFTEKGPKDFIVKMHTPFKKLKIKTKHRPKWVVLDHDFDLMRDLALDEFPPSISRLFGAEKRILVLPQKKELKIYKKAITFFKNRGFKPIERKELRHSMLKKGTFLVLGSVEGRLESFCPKIAENVDGVTMKMGINRLNNKYVVGLLRASSLRELQSALFKIPHYGKYSLLKFKDGILKSKKRSDFEKGISQKVTPGLSGVFSSKIWSTPGITRGLEGQKVVYLGEKHDQEGIHQAQLKIIQELSRREKLAVGMEMFQRPFQDVLNSYLAGKISEREFLKNSQYFKRWAFNYQFYRPIVEYCKANSIPIVALNLPTEISKKIARKGISGLSEEERKALPDKLDFTNELYKRYLKGIYAGHNSSEIDNFEYFFQAQVAWDETMAQSITDYLTDHPAYHMVILVGGGHIEYGYGIPSRVKRRLPEVSQVKALFNNDPLDPDKADLFLYALSLKEPFTPKLGVILTGKNRLTVKEVIPGSPAAVAGIKPGDIITNVDGTAVKDIYDLKLELFFIKRGEKVEIGVKRKDKKGNVKTLELLSGKLGPFSWRNGMRGFHSSR